MKKTITALSLIMSIGILEQGELRAQIQGENSYCQTCCCNPCCCIPKPKKCIDCECYTPPFYDLQCDWGVFINVDYLYWYAKENRLPFGAITQTTIDTEGDPIILPKRNVYMKEQWNSGFRVGLGFNSCDSWDLHFIYTWMKNCKSQSVNFPPFESPDGDFPAAGEAALAPPWYLFAFYSNENQAKWSLNYNILDIELGRKYWLSRCFNLRPYAGIRGAWTEQKYLLTNDIEGFIDDDDEIEFISAKNRFKNEFKGGGIKLGFDPTWYFSNCFAFYGQFSGSLLWGEFDGRKQEIYELELEGEFTESLNYRVSNDFNGMQSVFDLGIGLRYEDTYCCDRYRFTFDLGWEHHLWINHVHRILPLATFFQNDNDDVTKPFSQLDELTTDLGLGGLVVRVRLDF